MVEMYELDTSILNYLCSNLMNKNFQLVEMGSTNTQREKSPFDFGFEHFPELTNRDIRIKKRVCEMNE